MEISEVYFILIHKQTKEEIELKRLWIDDEYSSIAFGTREGDYNDKYNGIGRLPSAYNSKWGESEDQYDIYIVVDGIKKRIK